MTRWLTHCQMSQEREVLETWGCVFQIKAPPPHTHFIVEGQGCDLHLWHNWKIWEIGPSTPCLSGEWCTVTPPSLGLGDGMYCFVQGWVVMLHSAPCTDKSGAEKHIIFISTAQRTLMVLTWIPHGDTSSPPPPHLPSGMLCLHAGCRFFLKRVTSCFWRPPHPDQVEIWTVKLSVIPGFCLSFCHLEGNFESFGGWRIKVVTVGEFHLQACCYSSQFFWVLKEDVDVRSWAASLNMFASCSDAAAWLYNYTRFRELFTWNVAGTQNISVVSFSSFVISALHRGFAGFSISLCIFDPAGVDLFYTVLILYIPSIMLNSSEFHLAFFHFELLVEQLPLIMYAATSWTILIFTCHILIWC